MNIREVKIINDPLRQVVRNKTVYVCDGPHASGAAQINYPGAKTILAALHTKVRCFG